MDKTRGAVFLMNKTEKRMLASDGRRSCYIVRGEDGKSYGVFLDWKKAEYFMEQLELKFGAHFEVGTHSLGPSVFFKDLMEDYKE